MTDGIKIWEILVVFVVMVVLIVAAIYSLPSWMRENYQENADSVSLASMCISENPCSNFADGDWLTYAEPVAWSAIEMRIGYVIPEGTSGAVWKVKGGPETADIEIPEPCLQGPELQVRTYTFPPNDYTEWYCNSPTGYIKVHQTSGIKIYEEAVVWER